MADLPPPTFEAPPSQRERLYVACQVAGWGLFTLLYFMLVVVQGEVTVNGVVISRRLDASAASLVWAINCSGLLLTHLYRALIHRWGWVQLAWRSLLPRIVGAAVGVAAVWAAVAWPLSLFWDQTPPPVKISPFALAFFSVFEGSIVLFIWSVLYFGYHVFDRYRRSEIERWQLQSAVKEAELRALKSQINPHFIFNSLNSLRALIDENPTRARSAVTQLANLLRYSLQSGQLETVALEDELRVVNDYLALEQVRHEDRLRVRFDVSSEAANVAVPPMLVQTLVENAVKYGIAPRREGGEIAVVARCDASGLQLRVTNPGTLLRSGSSTGVGLRNAAERLHLLFGDRARLQLREEPPGQVVAEVDVPTMVRRNDVRAAATRAVAPTLR